MAEATPSSSSSTTTFSTLIASYPILSILSEYVSTLDLFHMALTSHSNHAFILDSRPLFERLQRSCLCDGRGLSIRQNFQTGPHSVCHDRKQVSRFDDDDDDNYEEPIEVQLYNIKCDETDALPCVRCGVNVCEKCRDYPRWPNCSVYTFGRPHLNEPCQSRNIICLCPPCDAKQEKDVAGKYLYDRCDCNVYSRWICLKCARALDREAEQYYNDHTEVRGRWTEDASDQPITKLLHDQHHDRIFWCTCGAMVPSEMDPRCMWCKRRHRPESEWWDEAVELTRTWAGFASNPFYEPDFPLWGTDDDGKYPTPYPKLGYDRPAGLLHHQLGQSANYT